MAVKNSKLVFGAGSYLAVKKVISIFVNQQNPAGQVQEFSGTNCDTGICGQKASG